MKRNHRTPRTTAQNTLQATALQAVLQTICMGWLPSRCDAFLVSNPHQPNDTMATAVFFCVARSEQHVVATVCSDMNSGGARFVLPINRYRFTDAAPLLGELGVEEWVRKTTVEMLIMQRNTDG